MRSLTLLISMVCLATVPVLAQRAAYAQGAAAGATSSCVDVTVNDHPALSFTCLNQRLAASANAADGPQVQLNAVAGEPGNQQLGQFNFSALSHRMGDNLGKSAYPQRPPPLVPPPLLGGVH